MREGLMDYDAIIIGAGLGGCAAGTVLAGEGMKVLILERMDKVGGRCSSEKREGFSLDLGAHGLFGCHYGIFEEACRRVSKQDRIKWGHFEKFLIKIEDTLIHLDGPDIRISGDNIDTITVHAGSGLQEMMNIMPRELINMGMGMVTQMMPMVTAMAAPIISQFDEVPLKDFIDKYIEWPKACDALELLQFAMFGTPSWLTSTGELFRTLLTLMEYFRPGINPMELFGFPMGGLISIPNTMCEGIKEHGGEIRTNTNVKKILIENGEVVGVELDNGEVINSPIIVSNGGIQETVADLVGEEQFESDYAEHIRDLIPGVSAFCIRTALDSKITDAAMGACIPRGGLLEYYHQLWDGLIIPDCPPPMGFTVPSNIDPSLAPEGKQLLITVGPMMYDCKEDYSKMEPLAFDSMEHIFPGFRDHVIWHDFLNPGTYAAFGEKKASAVGLAQCVGQVGNDRPSSKLPIEGLYACGGEAGRNISSIACDMCVRSGVACGDYIVQNSKVPTP